MCAIFGIFGHKDAASLAYLGLYALQHRGEESAGIVVRNGRKARVHKGMGLVSDVFAQETLKGLHGELAIGHTRYSTTGSSSSKNIQPFLFDHKKSQIAIAHNGNIINALGLRNALEGKGSIFQTTMDTEVIAHLIAGSEDGDFRANIIGSLSQVQGAYSLVMMFNDVLVGARDPYGFRPLCLGKLNDAYILAGETCALDLIGARYVRDIEPGEVVFIHKNGLEAVKPFPRAGHRMCIFEYIYFARPDSNIFGRNVYLTRKELGRHLARESPLDCDLVMPVPDSGNSAAIGFAQESDIPLEYGLIRNHYVGRTFIQPTQSIRDFRVKVKLNPIRDVLRGKRIVVIEDSIVRGTTSRIRVKTLRAVGVKQVHMRVSCPPLRFPCYFGIDFPTQKELIAARHSVRRISDFLGVDSLEYLSRDEMLNSMPLPKDEFCTACFDGNYVMCPNKKICKGILE
ncbi:MAG: amidophosphoribosyltransferase [Candidatus Omnitrophica bacterium]|nr:amidophosphoribosyltransferase [Candidatus Omnitrophota bacterium]